MLRIHNFRAGFATNSSSSHSIVLLPPGEKVSSDTSDCYGDFSYGWENFILADSESKIRYLATQLFCNYFNDNSAKNQLSERFSKEIAGLLDVMDSEDNPFSIDHQSVLGLPAKYNSEFIERLIKLFKHPRLVVLGGNDNSGPDYDDFGEEIHWLSALTDRGNIDYHVKMDGDFWVIFDSYHGTKMRVSFDADDINASSYTKSTTPELVDVKITDYCESNCSFCYQNSSKHGKHADIDSIDAIISQLKEMEVFEVAIGGGEPTKHPKFASILKRFSDANIVPNFTTYTDEWLENPAIVKSVIDHCGGIGVSCHDVHDLDLVRKLKQKLTKSDRLTIVAQHVLGSVPLSETAKLMTTAFDGRIGVILLGFKEVGRGKNYERYDAEGTPMFLKLALQQDQTQYVSLSVDTALVDRFPDLLTVFNVHKILVTSPEGKFSCYIDAVNGTMAPSSYVEKSAMTALPNNVDDFKKIYATY